MKISRDKISQNEKEVILCKKIMNLYNATFI